MTAEDVIDRARATVLNDTGASPRYTDAVLLGLVDEAQQAVYAERPDAFFTAAGVVAPEELSHEKDDLALGLVWKPVLVHYVVYRCYLLDAEHGYKDLALLHKGLFEKGLAA